MNNTTNIEFDYVSMKPGYEYRLFRSYHKKANDFYDVYEFDTQIINNKKGYTIDPLGNKIFYLLFSGIFNKSNEEITKMLEKHYSKYCWLPKEESFGLYKIINVKNNDKLSKFGPLLFGRVDGTKLKMCDLFKIAKMIEIQHCALYDPMFTDKEILHTVDGLKIVELIYDTESG